MSASTAASSPTVAQYLTIAHFANSEVGTPYVNGDTTLPTGYRFLTVNGAPVIQYDQTAGFYGAALVSSTGQIVITYEATNLNSGSDLFTAAQLLDDAHIAVGVNAASYADTLSFTQSVIADAEAQGYGESDISLTGHSLGGAEAEYAAAQTGLPATTFGAPGIPADDIPAGAPANVTDYVVRGDPVGNYAEGGNEDIILQSSDVVHYGSVQFVGSYLGTALLYSADLAYAGYLNADSDAEKIAALATTVGILGTGVALYHLDPAYASALGVSLTSTAATTSDISLDGLSGGFVDSHSKTIEFADIKDFDVSAPGAVTIENRTITLNDHDGNSAELTTSAQNTNTYSLVSDGNGGTAILSGAAPDGIVVGGADGATVQGDSKQLVFIGGTGSESVIGGSGDATLYGSTSSSANTLLQGGSGNNLLTAVAGNATLVGGQGSSTLVGGSGNTVEQAAGSNALTMVGGSGSTVVNGTTGSGSETVFTGPGTLNVALNGTADTVVAGSGIASIQGGTGGDFYAILKGHAGGNVIIDNVKATDQFAFGGYTMADVTSNQMIGSSNVITFDDGTIIELKNFDHKLF